MLSNQAIPDTIQAIPDIFRLMTRDALLAKELNAPREVSPVWTRQDKPIITLGEREPPAAAA